MIEGLLQVALKASDLDASVAFYRDGLGLRFLARFDPPGLAFFDINGVRLMLSATPTEGTVYLRVSALEAVVKTLEAKGIAIFQQPALVHRDEAGQFGKAGQAEWMAFIRDPGGNLVGLVERR